MTTKQKLRNIAHYILGVLIAFLLFQTYSGMSLYIQLFFTTFIVGVGSVGWEWGWKMYNDSKIDYKDVYRVVIGADLAILILNFI